MNGFLYAIGGESGQVKVGWSADPFRRLSKIRSDCPAHVSLLGLIPATRSQEQELHALLAPWRIRREWYRAEGGVAALVEMLPKPHPRIAASQADHPLRQWRTANSVSVADVAEKIGVTRTAVWRWEAGKREPNRRQRAAINKLTGIPTAELLAECAA